MAFVIFGLAGCVGDGGILGRWRIAHDDAIAPPPNNIEAGDTRGRIARLLAPERSNSKVDRDVQPAVMVPPKPMAPDVEREFKVAEDLYAAGRLDEAERAFIKLDRKRERGSIPEKLGFGRSKDDDKTIAGILRKSQPAWGERALFFLAESQYKQGKLIAAHDTIDKLLLTYPGTQYLDQAVAREHEIAKIWLAAAQGASATDKDKSGGSWTDRLVGRVPPVDVSGHALQVLEHVRQHDAKGPLAPEAAMQIADFHYGNASYEEAARYYDELISLHPKSELAPRAYLKTIDSKVKAYIGPKYDASSLAKAKDQIHQVMTLYPEYHAESSEKLSHTLDLIEDQEAEMSFRRGEFYRQTGYAGAAEMCFGEVKARWPKSAWAKLAQHRLEEIGRMPRKVVEPSKIMTQPGSTDPFAAGMSAGSTPSAASPLGNPGGP